MRRTKHDFFFRRAIATATRLRWRLLAHAMSLTGLPMLVLRFAPILFLLTSACGCSVLPGTGPAGSSLVVADDDVSAGGYAIVDINKEIVAALKLRPDPSLTSLSQYQPASAPVIGIGDTIRVTL